MPVKSKRSPPKKKPVHKVKATAKAKKPSARSLKLVAKPKTPLRHQLQPEGSSVLWKILAERKRRQEQAPQKQIVTNHRGTQYPPAQKHDKLARFAGPRRRAA